MILDTETRRDITRTLRSIRDKASKELTDDLLGEKLDKLRKGNGNGTSQNYKYILEISTITEKIYEMDPKDKKIYRVL